MGRKSKKKSVATDPLPESLGGCEQFDSLQCATLSAWLNLLRRPASRRCDKCGEEWTAVAFTKKGQPLCRECDQLHPGVRRYLYGEAVDVLPQWIQPPLSQTLARSLFIAVDRVRHVPAYSGGERRTLLVQAVRDLLAWPRSSSPAAYDDLKEFVLSIASLVAPHRPDAPSGDVPDDIGQDLASLLSRKPTP